MIEFFFFFGLLTILSRGGKWYVVSKKGRNLGGPYASRKQAEKRLHQVEFFKRTK